MKELKKILEVGSDGGSVRMFQLQNNFFFSTDEFLFVDEFNLDQLSSTSEIYATFEEAMIGILKKYSIFQLHPLYIDPYFKKSLKVYHDNFLLYQGEENCWSLADWKKCLSLVIK